VEAEGEEEEVKEEEEEGTRMIMFVYRWKLASRHSYSNVLGT